MLERWDQLEQIPVIPNSKLDPHVETEDLPQLIIWLKPLENIYYSFHDALPCRLWDSGTHQLHTRSLLTVKSLVIHKKFTSTTVSTALVNTAFGNTSNYCSR